MKPVKNCTLARLFAALSLTVAASLLISNCVPPTQEKSQDNTDDPNSDDASAWIVSKWTGILKSKKADSETLVAEEKSHRIVLDIDEDGEFTLINSDDKSAQVSGEYALLQRSLYLDIESSSWSFFAMDGERLEFDLVRKGRQLSLTNDDFELGLIGSRAEDPDSKAFDCEGQTENQTWNLSVEEETFTGKRAIPNTFALEFTGSTEFTESTGGKIDYHLVVEESNNDSKERGAVLDLKYKSKTSFNVEVKSPSGKVTANFVCRK